MPSLPPAIDTRDKFEFLVNLIRLFLALPGIFLTSYWRSPEFNARVGGSPNSLHLSALAADFDRPSADLESLVELANRALGLGLSALVYWGDGKSYVHVQARPLRGGSRLVVRTGPGPDEFSVLA